jgi:hypothetical protein
MHKTSMCFKIMTKERAWKKICISKANSLSWIS